MKREHGYNYEKEYLEYRMDFIVFHYGRMQCGSGRTAGFRDGAGVSGTE